MNNIILNNNVAMPSLGLGTYSIYDDLLIKVFNKAIEYGYNSFDTASAYQNQRALGQAIKSSGVRREDVFITSKLSNTEQRRGNIKESFSNTLKALDLEYLDLYLIHWPNPCTYQQSWSELEKLYKQGLIRAIGVCNFHEHHLKQLLSNAQIIPAINQVELHPLLSQTKLVEFCNNNTIKVQAYSPLARMETRLIQNEVLKNIAYQYNKTVVQIILRWNYQKGIVTIPKTSKFNRLKENIDIFNFEISEVNMKAIEEININFRVRHNPDNCDFMKL